MNRPYGVVLAGGRSQRFGSDKALHLIDGVSMIERAYRTISTPASPVLVSVGSLEITYDIPARHIPDIYPGCGPLAGLHAGLNVAETEWVVVLAVDLPYVTPESLNNMLARRSDTLDAVVARADGRVQPLCGCYRTSLAGRIEKRLRADERAVMAFLDTIRVGYVDVPEGELRNFNKPPESFE